MFDYTYLREMICICIREMFYIKTVAAQKQTAKSRAKADTYENFLTFIEFYRSTYFYFTTRY